ncbi:phosphonate C-P lyase system protein PhnH [Enterovibrio paralichthyis]|uniref:phosphonate C-P lyase system protein PhnH n=1 Tax=Enterovibrio paralichthyis TaxID=2853805 RepID=UPI001C47EF40|nr:phosphonate C-P lyase system protein PhnH [Enterovibrio paralichthyis]MBV7296934.1 phosphonate C-P lyase system protein PhnH [Enterovibrio paralichthyis]
MSKLTAGFDDPVHDAQQVFRELMDAMSQPGKRIAVKHASRFGKASYAATQVLLTLADNATPLWLSGYFRDDEALVENIRFHCAAPVIAEKSEATFALAQGVELEGVKAFAMGCESYPDKSTTLILEVESLDEGVTFSLTGPGIPTTAQLAVKGLNESLLASLQTERSAFPHGIDILFTSGHEVVALPRSTNLTLKSTEATCM